ncbi:MAG TPA: ABC transporter permease [Ignavibacteriaceae bacterium]|nr:ABC transporter permease [Ignavibacteriaceae bacterium]
MNFKKSYIVAKWEYLEKVKTKTFIISLFLTPLILIVFTILPTMLAEEGSENTEFIGFIDTSGVYLPLMREKLEQIILPNGQPNYILVNFSGKNNRVEQLKSVADSNVIDGRIEGYLIVYQINQDSLKLEYRSKLAGSFIDIQRFETAFNEARIKLKLIDKGIEPDVLKILSKKVNISQIKIEAVGKETNINFFTTFFSSIVFLLLLMMMIIYSGGMLVRSLLEEKSSRLMEILISSCTPDELITGKIFGLSALGLTQIIIWALVSTTLVNSAVIPAEIFNNILPVLLYFLLGFIFYSSIFVGIGSVVTSEQEAQMITTYLSFILVFPVVFSISIFNNPNSSLISILSYIPLTLPSVMILRINVAPISSIEIFLTIAIMLVSIYITIIVSSKIFRIGILSYGKRPSIKELISWLKIR